jgi:hypothetical protein
LTAFEIVALDKLEDALFLHELDKNLSHLIRKSGLPALADLLGS